MIIYRVLIFRFDERHRRDDFFFLRLLSNRLRLPEELENLVFGNYFNRPLQGVRLPQTLQELRFGDYFNQSFLAKCRYSYSAWCVLSFSGPFLEALLGKTPQMMEDRFEKAV